MPCRYNGRRIWTTRLMLEGMEHPHNSFVTLTYSPENYPEDGFVSIRHAQLFLKRLREREAPSRCRYFLVGEYGDVTRRGHYHAVLFNVDPTQHVSRRCSCSICLAWTIEGKQIGHVHVGELTRQSAQYVASYVVQDVSREESETFRARGIRGRSAKQIGKIGFSIMSRRPGIGVTAALRIAQSLKTAHGKNQLGSASLVDIAEEIQSLRLEGKRMPLGRFLRCRIKDHLHGGVKHSAWPIRRLELQRNRAGLVLDLKSTATYLNLVNEERAQLRRRSEQRKRFDRSRRIL